MCMGDPVNHAWVRSLAVCGVIATVLSAWASVGGVTSAVSPTSQLTARLEFSPRWPRRRLDR